MAYKSGRDRKLREPGTSASEKCGICGTEMDIERDRDVYTSYACAMAKKSVRMDAFYCPHNEEEWHNIASDLIDELNNTVSPTLREIMKKDLDKIITERR